MAVAGQVSALPNTDPQAGERGQSKTRPGASFAPGNLPANQPSNRTATIYDPNVRPVSGNTETVRTQHNWLLVSARKALAKGDLRTTEQFVAQAEALNVVPQPGGDSAEKVRALMTRHQRLLDEAARGNGNTMAYRRERATLLLDQALGLLQWNEADAAEQLASDARVLNATFAPGETSPEVVLDRITQYRRANGQDNPMGLWDPTRKSNTQPKPSQDRYADRYADRYSEAQPVGYNQEGPSSVVRGVTAVQPAGGQNSSPVRPLPPGPANVNRSAYFQEQAGPAPGPAKGPGPMPPLQAGEAMRLFRAAETAHRNRDSQKALMLYREAWNLRDDLDPATRETLQDRLQMLSAPRNDGGKQDQLIDQTESARTVLINQLTAEVTRQQIKAGRLKEDKPEEALKVLDEARAQVERSEVEQRIKDILFRRLDKTAEEVQRYLTANQAETELEQRNARNMAEVERRRQQTVVVREQLAGLVDEFNIKMDEGSYREAQLIARRAQIIAPEEPVVQNMMWQSRFVERIMRSQEIQNAKDEGWIAAMSSVDESSIPTDRDIQFPDAQTWRDLTDRRARLDGRQQRLSPAEIEIERKLKTPVSLQFTNEPLANVTDYLAQLAGINIFLDPQGLQEEGVLSNTPVTINVNQPISLRSALNLILEPLHLKYVIKDEVLKITSKSIANSKIYTEVYRVADLVIPIPNFVPTGNIGLAAAIQQALSTTRGSLGAGGGHSPVMAVAGPNGGSTNAMINPNIMAQVGGNAFGNGASIGGSGVGGGAAGISSATQPDFDSLVELITGTVEPNSWAQLGGPGTIKTHEMNLTLIVSNTQEVHEQIADLLNQLRRLQDLQVTLEVRFITLNDNFFERIGIDFDFDIDDDQDKPYQTFGQKNPNFVPAFNNVGLQINPDRDFQDRDHESGTTVGLAAPGVFSADLDIPFQQGSFGLSAPQFGGFTAGAGATMGFAILSDIEAFFFIEASQGDARNNVMQAPKVTLFNGQVAFVADAAQSPFVISVIPVVGDFAAAFQPVIVVLSEGTFLTVQAVVSPDRRFVRLTLVPFFSTIGDVQEFTFTGSSTTINNSSNATDGDDAAVEEEETQIATGTTVQLPTFEFVTVTTTVSVPDGGTVLLGGIKRLSEGRNEFGVPILNKVPYVNRLFRNVGIGRNTQSLMLMVTPRIIVQEEEEARLLGGNP